MVTHDNLGIHRFNIDAKPNLINLVTILLEILQGVKSCNFFLLKKKFTSVANRRVCVPSLRRPGI